MVAKVLGSWFHGLGTWCGAHGVGHMVLRVPGHSVRSFSLPSRYVHHKLSKC